MALGLFLPMVFCFAAAKPGEPDERYRMASVVELERSEKIQTDTPIEDERIAAKERIVRPRTLPTQTAAKERDEKFSEKKGDFLTETADRFGQRLPNRQVRGLLTEAAVKDRFRWGPRLPNRQAKK